MIILVGGAFTPDGGSPIDSRQRLAGDDHADAMRRSLGGSWFWWASVASVVIPILESAGPNAYALVVGERSVHELKPDGSTARESLRRLLPGGTGKVDFVPRARTEEGEIGVSPDSAARYELSPGQSVRWRFVDGSDPDLERFSAAARPAVIVDTSAAIYTDQPAMRREQRRRLDRRFVGEQPPILVLPHTAVTEGVISAYLEWRNSGRPEVPMEDRPQTEQAWLDTPPDPMSFTQMVPVQADLRISGLVKEGAWAQPDDLEAARQLLQARFDLRIGIWDLVDNAVLRESLLVDAPIAPAPAEQVPVPRGAAIRATAAAEKKIAQQERLREILGVSDPLASLGWVTTQLEPYSLLCLPLSEPVAFGSRPRPVAYLALLLTRHEASVIARAAMAFRGLSLGGHVEQYRKDFEDISGGEVVVSGGLITLWKEPGGWADEVDWEERFRQLAMKSGRWSKWLAPIVSALHRALGQLRGGP